MDKNAKVQKAPIGAAEKRGRGKKIIMIVVSVYIALSVILGAVLGIVSAARTSKAAVSLNGVLMDTKTVSFFAGYYKNLYKSALAYSGVEVIDEPAFWNKKAEGGNETYGDILKEGAERYIKRILSANYLYESYTLFSSEEREAALAAAEDVLLYSEAGGDVIKLNELLSDYGFDYETLKTVAEMMYKANAVHDVIYGSGGSSLEDMTLPNARELCEEYLMEYSHVRVIAINTETKFKLDAGGDKIVGVGGKYETTPLSSEERAQLLSEIEEIRGYISAIGTDADMQMSPIMFDGYIEKYADGEVEMPDGEYFHPNSMYTESDSPVIKKAYEMKIGEYAEVEIENGVAFIYKEKPESGAYLLSTTEKCFVDFYSDLSQKLFNESLEAYSDDVKFTEKYNDVDIILVPYNFKYVPKF